MEELSRYILAAMVKDEKGRQIRERLEQQIPPF